MFSRIVEEKKLKAVCGPESSVYTQMGNYYMEIVFTTVIDGSKYGVATDMNTANLAEDLESMHKDMAGLIRK